MLEAARSVQFAWFFGQTPEITADKALKDLLGLDADQMQTNRVPSPQTPFLSSAVRSDRGLEFRLNVGPGRADLFIRPAANTLSTDGSMPLVNVGEVVRDVFRLFQKGNMNCFGAVYRAAMVAPFLVNCASREEAQKMFVERVGLGAFDGPVSDLAFSFNKRKISAVDDIKLNRVMNYSVAEFQKVRFGTEPNGGESKGVVGTNFAFELNVDINSVPSEPPISSGSLLPLFEVMFAEMEGATSLKSPRDLK